MIRRPPRSTLFPLHDALPISLAADQLAGAERVLSRPPRVHPSAEGLVARRRAVNVRMPRSEEHTSELQSRQYLVCRLLLEKKNTTYVKLLVERRKAAARDEQA